MCVCLLGLPCVLSRGMVSAEGRRSVWGVVVVGGQGSPKGARESLGRNSTTCSFGFEEYERTRWKGVNRLPPCGWKLLVPLTAFLIL